MTNMFLLNNIIYFYTLYLLLNLDQSQFDTKFYKNIRKKRWQFASKQIYLPSYNIITITDVANYFQYT